MIFKKRREIIDQELGLLKANAMIIEPSITKWKRKIVFLGFEVDIEISGTVRKLNNEQRMIIIQVLKEKDFFEKKVLDIIRCLCFKNGISFEMWGDYFKCTRIYASNKSSHISIKDQINNLTYELELKGI